MKEMGQIMLKSYMADIIYVSNPAKWEKKKGLQCAPLTKLSDNPVYNHVYEILTKMFISCSVL